MSRGNIFLKTVRAIVSGEPAAAFAFERPPIPEVIGSGATDAYLHVPFCPNQCRYCPYNTVAYNPANIDRFFAALRREAEGHRKFGKYLQGNSLYLGGGSPASCHRPLFQFLAEWRQIAGDPAEIAIELHPGEVTGELIAAMKQAGVTQVSLGVQSFDDKILRFLGRSYPGKDLPRAIGLLAEADFDNFNLDLIFGIQGQSKEEWRNDLTKALTSGATQITAYPFFHFSFVRTKAEQKKVAMLPLWRRKVFYDMLWAEMTRQDWRMSSVWSFQKPGRRPSFSSVSRDNFIGLGPGSASKTATAFGFNTFHLDGYLQACAAGRPPVSLTLKLSPNLEALYRLYWLFYAGKFPRDLSSYPLRRRRLLQLGQQAMRLGGMLTKDPADGRYYRLTRRGAFWGHWLQNCYIIHYIDQMWGKSLAEAYPDKVILE